MRVLHRGIGEFDHQAMDKVDGIPLFGASLLSAAGSLPLHLMPLIVVGIVADSRASIASAGWVASAVLIGQLLMSLALPALKVQILHRAVVACLLGLLLSGLAVTILDSFWILLLGWGTVGGCCGALQYLGVMTASSNPRPVLAFSLRLGVVLILAGAVASLLQATNVFASYRSLVAALLLVFAFVLAIGVALYRPVLPPAMPLRKSGGVDNVLSRLSGLATVYLLFFGLTGFLAYVAHGALARGIALADTVWTLAAMKIVTGGLLLSIAHVGVQNRTQPRFLELGLLLAISIAAVFAADGPIMFLVGLLGLEISFNVLGARLQARVSETAPQVAGMWLTGIILLGAASGPPLHGVAIGADVGVYFVAFAMLSALFPALWARYYGK